MLPHRKESGHEVRGNAEASLVDLGDGVACLEFHSKMNTLSDDVIDMIFESLEEVETAVRRSRRRQPGAPISARAPT